MYGWVIIWMSINIGSQELSVSSQQLMPSSGERQTVYQSRADCHEALKIEAFNKNIEWKAYYKEKDYLQAYWHSPGTTKDLDKGSHWILDCVEISG